MKGTGSLARKPDNQEREEIFESANSQVIGGSDMQLNLGHQASVSGQSRKGIVTPSLRALVARKRQFHLLTAIGEWP